MDPFSVATGGAGLASLGITICDGLLTYCINFRSRGEDLLILSQRTKELKDLLRQLESLTKRDAGITDNIESSLKACCTSCTSCLQEIDAFDSKYLQPRPSTPKDHGTAIAKRFQYPFQKGRLEELRHQLHELQVVLSNQLLLLNSNLTIDLHRLTTTESETTRTEIVKHSDHLLSVVSSTGPVIQRILDDNLSKIEETLERRLENLEELITASFERLRSGNRQGLDDYKCKSTDTLGPNQNMPNQESTLILSDALVDLNCYCPWTESGSHQSTCIYSFRLKKRRKTLTGMILFFNLIFKFKIETQYSPSAFPWDFQIYPNLSITAVVQDSPAWRLLDHLYTGSIISPEKLRNKCQHTLKSLIQYYSSGQCQPTDVDHFGRNLCHQVIFPLLSQTTDDEDCMLILLQFFKGLVRMGVPLKQVAMPISVPLTMINIFFFLYPGQSSHVTTLVRGIIELGAELIVSDSAPLSGLGGLSCLPYERRRDMKITIPSEYGELSRAILRQSEAEVRQVLSKSKLSILERSPSGETPIHLAACWARGLAILLQYLSDHEMRSVLDAEDCVGDTPLWYALKLHNLECVALFMNSGAYLDLEDTHNMELSSYPTDCTPQTDDIIRLLSEGLAKQRKQLLRDALEWLPASVTSHLGQPPSHQMLQETAFDVAAALRDEHHAMSWPRPRPGSIYHATFMSANLAKALYKVGFDRTNILFNGFSPLMTISLGPLGHHRGLSGLLDLVDWFVDHGADISAPMPLSIECHDFLSNAETKVFSVVQRCAYWIGFYCFSELQLDHLSQLACVQRIARLLQVDEDQPKDPCVCSCTSQGCSPVSTFIRGLLRHDVTTTFNEFTSKCPVIFHLYDRIQCKQAASRYRLDVLRTLTFHSLEMRHICCEYDLSSQHDVGQAILEGEFQSFYLKDPDEMKELQHEDRYRAERLEELMVEFEEMYEQSGESFQSFYLGYYSDRMNAILSERDVLSPEDISRIQEMGVILDMGDESES